MMTKEQIIDLAAVTLQPDHTASPSDIPGNKRYLRDERLLCFGTSGLTGQLALDNDGT